MRRPRACSIAALSIAALLAGCSSGTMLNASREDLIPVQAGDIPTRDVETSIIPTEDRADPVRIVGLDARGATIDTAQMRGAPVVINAWASWCAPCIDEAPVLTEAAQDPGTNVTYLGLRVMDGDQEPPPALAAMPFASIVDTDGAVLASIPGVPPRALPSTTILDAEGRIAAQRIGPLTSQILDQMLTAVER